MMTPHFDSQYLRIGKVQESPQYRVEKRCQGCHRRLPTSRASDSLVCSHAPIHGSTRAVEALIQSKTRLQIYSIPILFYRVKPWYILFQPSHQRYSCLMHSFLDLTAVWRSLLDTCLISTRPSLKSAKMSAASSDIEAFVLLACAAFLIIVRSYVRLDLVGLKKLKLDDYLMLLTGVSLDKYHFCFEKILK